MLCLEIFSAGSLNPLGIFSTFHLSAGYSVAKFLPRHNKGLFIPIPKDIPSLYLKPSQQPPQNWSDLNWKSCQDLLWFINNTVYGSLQVLWKTAPPNTGIFRLWLWEHSICKYQNGLYVTLHLIIWKHSVENSNIVITISVEEFGNSFLGSIRWRFFRKLKLDFSMETGHLKVYLGLKDALSE